MDDNKSFNTNSSPANFPPATPNLGGQAGGMRPTPPPPPPPEITLRTMKSDLQSLKETGGSVPQLKPFTPPELRRDIPRPVAPLPPPPRITPSEFDKPRFETKTSGPQLSKSPVIEEEAPKSDMKKILMWIGIAVVAVGVGFAGYYYVFPMLFPAEVPAPILNQPQVETLINQPADQGAEIPMVTNPLVEPKLHVSFLKSSDAVATIQLAMVDVSNLTSAIQTEAQKEMPSGNLVEVTISDSNGQAALPSVFSSIIPEFTPEKLAGIFEDDFTTALYYDANGAWPIYIMKMGLESNLIDAQTEMNKLEASINLKNLFLKDPGAPNSAGFKTGQVSGVSTRYLTYSASGAALNTAWVNDKFIISASYNGLKKVLTNLK